MRTEELIKTIREDDAKAEARHKANKTWIKRNPNRFNKALAQIQLYEPCVCGSGKKWKFCHA